MQTTGKHKYIVAVDWLTDLTLFDLVVCDATGDDARVGVLCCVDDDGSQFSFLGPVRALYGLPLGVPLATREVDERLPIYRAGWLPERVETSTDIDTESGPGTEGEPGTDVETRAAIDSDSDAATPSDALAVDEVPVPDVAAIRPSARPTPMSTWLALGATVMLLVVTRLVAVAGRRRAFRMLPH